MVSATCPSCKILLVEADSPSFANLAAAVNYAATQAGVVAISNSYGGADSQQQASAYNHPGIAITASSGDNGYGVLLAGQPADGDRCRWYQPDPPEQRWPALDRNGLERRGQRLLDQEREAVVPDSVTQCTKKAVSDVSAVADPNTGVAVYDSTPYQGQSGWFVVGGTSASSPIIASVYALGGNTAGYPGGYTWAHTAQLNDVTVGANGVCAPLVWCVAGSGWDGPTGLGTPNGVGAF